MATGFCPAILTHLKSIAGTNYGGTKITEQGFLQMLVNQPDRPNVITRDGYGQGHRRTVNVKYRPRVTESVVSTTADCDIDSVQAYKETSATMSKYVQINTHFDEDTIRQYCEDASRTVMIGGIATPMMDEVLQGILHTINPLYAKMETILTTTQGLAFGRNPRAGTTASQNINIALDSSVNNLQTGVTRILGDARQAEFCGTPQIVGNGNFMLWDMQVAKGGINTNQSGLNNQNVLKPYEFFYSQKTASTWGDNQIGVFAPGSVHLIENMYNVGNFAGDFGAVQKGTLSDPRMPCWTNKGFNDMQFDFMLKYIDCPTSLTNGYTGNTATYNSGWVLMISKHFDLFTMPSDQFDGMDPIVGSNGTLRYTIQNA